MAQIDEQNVDTPEQGSNLSVEDAFFSGQNEGSTEQPINPVSEDVVSEIATPEVNNDPNDAKRFQYWQSEADKAKNENEALKQQLNTMQAQANTQQAQAPVQEEKPEEFPPPPPKPGRPSGFNRAEAMEDPSSPSARYLDEVEAWRDDMTEYGTLKNEYNNAIVKERLDKEQQRRVENTKRAQAQQQANQQIRGIYEQVQATHGLNEQEAKQFINEMSKPESLSVDNLVELWRIKNGSGANVTSQPTQPSDTFNQQARAQQVASPMGVMPSQQPTQQSAEESIMDSMINDYKKSNPW
jgi:hypothetical protein|tara:strand:- start:988 stop:1878 length:891 start_codon:yes stop_codon:yes gene_type:complete